MVQIIKTQDSGQYMEVVIVVSLLISISNTPSINPPIHCTYFAFSQIRDGSKSTRTRNTHTHEHFIEYSALILEYFESAHKKTSTFMSTFEYFKNFVSKLYFIK